MKNIFSCLIVLTLVGLAFVGDVHAKGRNNQEPTWTKPLQIPEKESPFYKPCMSKKLKIFKGHLEPLIGFKPETIFVEGIYEERGSTDKLIRCKLMGFVQLSEKVMQRVKVRYTKEVESGWLDSIIAELGVTLDVPEYKEHKHEEGSSHKH